MPEYLKRGKTEAERAEDDAKVRSTVEGIPRRTSRSVATQPSENCHEKFDNYAPESFRLSEQDIERRHVEGVARVTWMTSSLPKRRSGVSPKRSAPR